MIHLLAAFGILIGIVWAFVVFPSFRIVVAILLVAGIGMYFTASEKAAERQKQEQTKAKQEHAEFEVKQSKYCEDEVPCDQFGHQEPGSDAEIATFCRRTTVRDLGGPVFFWSFSPEIG